MRIAFLACFICFFSIDLSGQTPQRAKRKISYRSLGKDSINLHLDKDYFLIEDTCSSIIRYGRFNFQKRFFYGPFRDLNKMDPMIIVSEGRYSDEGKLDGPFVLRYLNNIIQAKGSFINGVMDGAWELFYEDGKPWMTFQAVNNQVKVADAWDKSGRKIVEGGKGDFRAEMKAFYWEGKLLNGVPNGSWRLKKTVDRTNTVVASEVFKNGSFVKGSGPAGAYADESRIVLVTPDILPISNAALMRVSAVACDPANSRKSIVSAVYSQGSQAFSEAIKARVAPFLSVSDHRMYNKYDLVLEGTVNTSGAIEGLRLKSGFDDKITSGIIKELRRLPHLEPALVNGKPVSQGVTFTFKFSEGWYSFSYRFLPVTVI